MRSAPDAFGEAGYVGSFWGGRREHSQEEHPQVSLVAKSGVEPHRGFHRRLEIWQAYQFELSRDSEGESESRMGVGKRSPFIYCS